MDKRRLSELKTLDDDFQDVSSMEWEFIDMSEQEEDLVHRMYKLVGDRWSLIAGRIPGRTPEAIERFWKMAYDPGFAEMRLKRRKRTSTTHGDGDTSREMDQTH